MAFFTRILSSLRNLTADNGHTFYFASPGYPTNKVVTGGAGAITITVPTDTANGVLYRGVNISAGGNLYYINAFTTATGSGSNQTAGVADLESPRSLSLYNSDANQLGTVAGGAPITSFTIYVPVTCTVFFRWYN